MKSALLASAAGPAPPPSDAERPTRCRQPFPIRLRDVAQPHRRRRPWLAAVASLLAAGSAWGTGFQYGPLRSAEAPNAGAHEATLASPRQAARLVAEERRLAAALQARTPREAYVVIDQTHNRLRLMRDRRVLLEAPCSAGSGMVLKEGAQGRVWVFDTPRGAFRVLSKLRNPVWRKPDWAFVEEGVPIPADPGQRIEYGALGEYALHFGNGYLIHGTLYERLIGRPVSHGCIRVGREPLRELYRSLRVGARVYVF